jgi:hypothetical protein
MRSTSTIVVRGLMSAVAIAADRERRSAAGCVAFGAATDPADPLIDQRSHPYLGCALKVSGRVGSEAREFLVSIGQGAHTKHHFRAGNAVSGDAQTVPDPHFETVEFYKISNLKVGPTENEDEAPPPPWRGV